MNPRPTLYILDAYSLIFQVFHAIPEMGGPAGQPTHAVFGIFRDILNLLRQRRPDYLAAAFDGGGKVFRSDLLPSYKGQRKEMPPDLSTQIPVIKRLFEAFHVPVLVAPGFEADDILATLARRGADFGLDVFLCTADKDARQLLNDQIRVWNVRKQEIFDEASLRTEWGIRPDQVVDLLALTGDAVDNVPGVPGIGPKTAAKLLNEIGDLGTLLADPSRVAAKKAREGLEAHAETVRLGRQLIALREDVPLAIDWDDYRVSGYDTKALIALCQECGFHGFQKELVDATGPVEAEWVVDYRTVDTPAAFAEFLDQLREQPRFCFDTETTAIDPLRAEIVGYAFAWEPGVAYYLPVRGPSGATTLDPASTLEGLRPILTDPAVEKVGQNLKYDMLALGRAGVELAGPITDTMILSYLLESGERNHGLDELSRRLLDHSMIPITDLIGKGKGQVTIDQVPIPKVAEYAGEDAVATWRIYEILAPRVAEEGLWDLYADLERPLISVLTQMEAWGIRIDVGRLRELSLEFATRLEAIKTRIYEEAGREFNIGSGPQLRQILFNELKLPSTKKTPKGEPSTDAEVLEELAPRHPLPRLIVQHRQLDKLKSTYLDALPDLVLPSDGRVHASFHQTVAATGRLSSSDPNLQNIPVRTEDGRQIRQAFVPGEPGWSLLTADYSQIELRILAHYSQDPALRQAFAEDRDIHSVVASRIFGVAESAVTSSQRRVAKTVNFGIVYGIKPYGLSARLGISQSEAAKFIDAYFQEYAGVEAFMTRTLKETQAAGRVETMLGRRRSISGIKSLSPRNLDLAGRLAVNTPIQGTAADLIKRAMLEVDRRLKAEGLAARMLLQIHDELLFEVPYAEIPILTKLAREAMTGAMRFEVPLKVDVAVGPNWLEVEDQVEPPG